MERAGGAPGRVALYREGAPCDESTGRFDQVVVRPHAGEDTVRHHDGERPFQCERELGEIERIGGEVVAQGNVREELLGADAEVRGDEAPDARLERFVQGGAWRREVARGTQRPSFPIAMSAVSMRNPSASCKVL